jgi:hypothetical protein
VGELRSLVAFGVLLGNWRCCKFRRETDRTLSSGILTLCEFDLPKPIFIHRVPTYPNSGRIPFSVHLVLSELGHRSGFVLE